MDVSDKFELITDTDPFKLPVKMPNVTMVQVADMNGDGITDILAASDNYGRTESTYPAYLLLGDEDGGYSIGARLPGRYVPRDMAVGDFNGDGVDDFYVAYTGPDTNPAPGERDVLMLSDGDGWKSAAMPQQANGFSHSAAAADIDGDGDIDIYVQTNGNGDNAQPYLLMNDGSGNFTLNRDLLPESLATQNSWESMRRWQWAEFGDLNGDGKPDLVTGKQEEPGTPRKSMIYLNQGGYFDDAHSFVLPDHAKLQDAQEVIDIRMVDLDNDGKDEIVSIGQGRREGVGYTPEFVIQVFSVSDDGHVKDVSGRWFGENKGYFSDTDIPYFLEFQDVNGDGKIDILPFMPGGGLGSDDTPMVLLNGGRGVFESITAAEIDADRTFMFGTATVPVMFEGALRFVALGTDEAGNIQYGYFQQIADLPNFKPRLYREGNAKDNTFWGGAGNDTLVGNRGDDTLNGRFGADDLRGGWGNDKLNGGAGGDVLDGSAGRDRLVGAGGRDTLLGGGGKDVLMGGAGNDRLNGGKGPDALKGGAGKDVFIFQKGAGHDRIMDFQDDVDSIRLAKKLGIASVDDALDHASQVNGNVVFDFGRDQLTVLDTTKAELHDDLVIF